jgi:hypothetical protein
MLCLKKVVGIAYEEGPSEQRLTRTAAAVKKFGTNYPILVGCNRLSRHGIRGRFKC